MDPKNFKGSRWVIVSGKYEGVEKYAVDELHKLVQQYVPYVLPVFSDDTDSEKFKNYNVIFIGTEESNRYIAKFKKDGIVEFKKDSIVKFSKASKDNTDNSEKGGYEALSHAKQGYTMKVCESCFNTERQMIILAGMGENGVLYAIRDFEHYYCDAYLHNKLKMSGVCIPFIEPMPEYEITEKPVVENRGLWTWGHVIYDYRRYLDNMSKWKMNIVTIWNDYAPVNAREIVDYAHSRGIKVVWGYTWCWGESVDPTNKEDLEKWTKRVMDTYETQYAGTGEDGIYFQTFTETSNTTIDGLSISDLVVKWVNHIGGKMLEKYPDLWINFGLHATSVKDEYIKLADIDPRINITWEDAGCFPYGYDPKIIENFQQTLDFTSKISNLRGDTEDFGAVLKGMINLDWSAFENQKGPFILGEAKQSFVKSRAREKEALWKYVQAYWLKNLEYVQNTIKAVNDNNPKKVSIEALVEDGLWEENMWLPVTLFAELLWNPYRPLEELVAKVMLASDSYLA